MEAGLEVDAAVGERAGADLRTGQVGEHADRPLRRVGDVADRGQASRCSSTLPWLRLRRTTSTPARAPVELLGPSDAGPIVATIFVRRVTPAYLVERWSPLWMPGRPRRSHRRLRRYLDASPSPWHAVRTSAQPSARPSSSSTSRSGADAPPAGFVVAAARGRRLAAPGGLGPAAVRIVGAHTDSPGLRVKPNPDQRTPAGASSAWRSTAACCSTAGSTATSVSPAGSCSPTARDLVDVAEPIARVPQLAIHLDRDVNERGVVLDRQAHHPCRSGRRRWTSPFATGSPSGRRDGVPRWEPCLYDVQPAAVLGADRSLLASGRLDNQASCWAATTARWPPSRRTTSPMIALFDHEEVGSASTTGASGPFLGR